MKKVFWFLVLCLFIFSSGICAAQEPKTANWTDLITIRNTYWDTISTPKALVTNWGGFIIICNEGTPVLRIGITNSVLSNGFPLYSKEKISLRLWPGQTLWVGCETSTRISYLTGE